MRGTLISFATAALLFGPGGDATAQDERSVPDISGKYRVKFEEVQNSCTSTSMSLSQATVELAQPSRRKLRVQIPKVPKMEGRVSKGGKFKAKGKKDDTPTKGVNGRFSISGRVRDGVIQFVLIAEYYRGDKPLCTQSWNASGVGKDDL